MRVLHPIAPRSPKVTTDPTTLAINDFLARRARFATTEAAELRTHLDRLGRADGAVEAWQAWQAAEMRRRGAVAAYHDHLVELAELATLEELYRAA